MSSKVERPTLQGQRIKTRKRDEKEKFDPGAFRDSILQGFQEIILCPTPGRQQQPQQIPLDQQSSNNSTERQATKPENNDVKNKPGDQTEIGSDPVSGSDKESPIEVNGTLGVSTTEGQPSSKTETDIKLETEISSQGTGNCSGDSLITKDTLEAISKFLDSSAAKLDYRRYGEVLFDILIAGGILAPGGTIVIDPDPSKPSKTNLCVFTAPVDDLEIIRGFANLIVKLIRRLKYLEKTLEEEIKKIIVFLKGFTPEERVKLAKFTAILIAGGQISPSVISSALQDHYVKDGIAIDFLVVLLQTWALDKDVTTVWAALKKAGLDQRIMDFFPASKRTPENLNATFEKAGLNLLLNHQKAGLSGIVKKELQVQVNALIKEDAPVKEIISSVKETVSRTGLMEAEVVVLLWNTLMSGVEWNKKEELVAEQALKHLKGFTNLLAAFATTPKAELALIVRIQEFCYENMNFLKVFQKIVLLFYKADVLSEDVILKWYKESHSSKGKSVFLDQMKKFVEWLNNAEEESEGEE